MIIKRQKEINGSRSATMSRLILYGKGERAYTRSEGRNVCG